MAVSPNALTEAAEARPDDHPGNPAAYPPDYTKNFDDVLIAEHLLIAARRDFNKVPGGPELKKKASAAQVKRGPEFAQWNENWEEWLKKPKAVRGGEPQDKAPEFSANGIHQTTGLALSGGGIRSAAFCLGAMQALSVKNHLLRFDYISSVSGGGYSSIAATLAANSNGGKFPFVGGQDDLKDTFDMRTLRNNANYLKFGKFVPMLKNLAIVCKGVATNIILTIAVLLLFAAFSLWSNPTILSLDEAGFAFISNFLPAALKAMPFGVSVLVFVIGFFISMWWAVHAGIFNTIENFKSNLLVLSSVWIMLAVLSVFFELQPVLVKQMISEREIKIARGIDDCLFLKPPNRVAGLPNEESQQRCKRDATNLVDAEAKTRLEEAARKTAANKNNGEEPPEQDLIQESSGFKKLVEWLQALLAPALAFAALASRYVGDLLKAGSEGDGWGPAFKRLTGRAIVWAAGLALPVVLWVAYLGLFYWGVVVVNGGTATAMFAPSFLTGFLSHIVAAETPYAFAWFYLAVAIVLIFVWLLASAFYPNVNSLHGLYRGRLGNAFCAPWAIGNSGEMKLSAIDTLRAPIHLINSALNVQASDTVNRRGRNADFFVLSNSHVGSAATGYAATARYEKNEKRLDFSSAMAISGAAASANMGSQSIRPLTFTLALLNIRLGAWLRNLMLVGGRTWPRDPFYFYDELMGRLKEDRSMIYLTDGGHIENLGIYELLRRRCKLIVAVDAEADREMNFSSLITLQRYARIDFGCRIDLHWKKIRQQSLIVQKGNAAASSDKKGANTPVITMNGPHCAIGKINYEGGGSGILLYVKSSLSGDENDYILDYNRRNYDFPHETTGDQNFSEEQFEVYRALGFHAMHGAVSGKANVQISETKLVRMSAGSSAPAIVKEARELLGL